MKKYIYLLFYCFVCSLPLFAQENGTPRQQAISQKDIFISFDCVKHLVFPVQVSDIAIGEQELVMASRVEEAPHIVRLSAQAEGFTEETNLTVVCIDGSVYTYHIRYLPEKKRNIYSLGVIENKFELSMANLYVHEDFMFFIFDLKNKSYIDYDIEFVKCFQRDQKKSKNAIQQETTIEPIYQKDFDTKIKGKSRNRLILGFDKFTIPDDKVFEIEIYERNGGRHIKLAVLNEYILSAEPLYKPQP